MRSGVGWGNTMGGDDKDPGLWEMKGKMCSWKTTSLEIKTFLELRLRSLYPLVVGG